MNVFQRIFLILSKKYNFNKKNSNNILLFNFYFSMQLINNFTRLKCHLNARISGELSSLKIQQGAITTEHVPRILIVLKENEPLIIAIGLITGLCGIISIVFNIRKENKDREEHKDKNENKTD